MTELTNMNNGWLNRRIIRVVEWWWAQSPFYYRGYYRRSHEDHVDSLIRELNDLKENHQLLLDFLGLRRCDIAQEYTPRLCKKDDK